MSVKAKFKVTRWESSAYKRRIDEKKPWEDSNIEKVELRTIFMAPVYGNGDPNHENTKFFQATPVGEIKMGVVNQEVWKEFDLEEEYIVTFERAPGKTA